MDPREVNTLYNGFKEISSKEDICTACITSIH